MLICLWPWDDEPCERPPRNPYACLCLIHLSQVDQMFKERFRRLPYHLYPGVRYTLGELEEEGILTMEQTAIDHRGMDRVLGNVDQFPELAAIIGAIFSHTRNFTLPNGTKLGTRILANGACFAVDYQGRRYIEQNRHKPSPEGERARAGARIIWVIQTHNDEGKPLSPNLWIGKIEDGIVRLK